MAGTLPSLPLVQQMDINGQPLSGCRLFLYLASTTTPATAFKVIGLTAGQEHSWPIVADALGRIPMFWLADGYYRARLEDRYGGVIFDEQQMPALGAGGGGGSTVTENPAFKTGDVLWTMFDESRIGWIRANGRTIGNGSSGASERAHPTDTRALFNWTYSRFSDARCPVSGGRSGNSNNDFDAGKTIQLVDMRGFGVGGVDGMGNSLSTRLGAGIPIYTGETGYDTGGMLIGESVHKLTVPEMPAHLHNGSSAYVVEHYHMYDKPNYGSGNIFAGGSPGTFSSGSSPTQTSGVANTGGNVVNLSIASEGGNAYHNTTPLLMLGYWLQRL